MTRARQACQQQGVRLAGTGLAVPESVVTNDELSKRVDTSDEWIAQRTGIKQRYLAAEGVTERDLARGALEQALDSSGIGPDQLDMLICATMTAEMCCPSTAARVVSEVGAVPAGAVDISAACSGFVYGLNLASSLIESGRYRNVAVIGTEVLSRILDWEDRRTCVLFGDGAAGVVLSASDRQEQGCIFQTMHSNGGLWKELYVPRTGAHVPEDGQFNGSLDTLQMNGREVYRYAVTTLQNSIQEALDACEMKASDLKVIIPHQSNKRILESAREKLGLKEDQLYINIERYGNTSAASVPICLHELWQAGRLEEGDKVLFVGLGGGMTWASSLWQL